MKIGELVNILNTDSIVIVKDNEIMVDYEGKYVDDILRDFSDETIKKITPLNNRIEIICKDSNVEESELYKNIIKSEIDKITDDEEFCAAENDFIRQYCIDKKFEISEEDFDVIKGRGLTEAFYSWEYDFKYDNGI